MPTGKLNIEGNISSLDTTRMKREGPGDKFGNATNFLVNERGLGPNDFISVTSGPGTTASVIFVLDAGLVGEGSAFVSSIKKGSKKTGAKKGGGKAGAKKAGKAAKGSAKKGGARKTAKKSGAKKASKKKSGK